MRWYNTFKKTKIMKINGQTDRQTDRPTDNQTDRQTDKQTDLKPTSGAIITTLPAAGSTI